MQPDGIISTPFVGIITRTPVSGIKIVALHMLIRFTEEVVMMRLFILSYVTTNVLNIPDSIFMVETFNDNVEVDLINLTSLIYISI